MTIYQELKVKGWKIKRKTIQDLGVNPDKDWNSIMLYELNQISEVLDVTISDLLHYLN